MAKKKKLLPKNFEDLLEAGDLAALQAVYDTCELDARGGLSKRTAFSFDECPDALARWLVEQGADIGAADEYGNTALHVRARSRRGRIESLLALGADPNDGGASVGTPLHAACDSHNPENVRILVAHGARVDAEGKGRLTPLELALAHCSNIDIENMVPIAETLLAAGAAKTPRMKDLVVEIGKTFEFHRGNFDRKSVGATSAALDRLYAIFDVAPVAPRELHDGKAPIAVRAKTWQKQHEELWELLVPSSGAAATVQGEVVRIAGRIAHEIDGNGGVNWDGDFRRMARAYLEHVESGKALAAAALDEARAVVAELPASDAAAALARLGVQWVLQNPAPTRLAKPAYKR